VAQGWYDLIFGEGVDPVAEPGTATVEGMPFRVVILLNAEAPNSLNEVLCLCSRRESICTLEVSKIWGLKSLG
jgi:hypothetical protein